MVCQSIPTPTPAGEPSRPGAQVAHSKYYQWQEPITTDPKWPGTLQLAFNALPTPTPKLWTLSVLRFFPPSLIVISIIISLIG